MDPMVQYFDEERKQKLERYRRLNKFVKKGQILFVGSSLMEQFPIYEFIQDYDIDKVIYNRGVGGFTTLDMLETMEECIFELEPSRIFINIGTNDMNGEDFQVEKLMGNYEQIIQQIKTRLPKARIYLMAYYPVNKEAANDPFMQQALSIRTNDRIRDTNQEVVKLAMKYGEKYIDVNKNLYDELGRLKEEYTIEGMHMYVNGYRAVLDELMKYIMEP